MGANGRLNFGVYPQRGAHRSRRRPPTTTTPGTTWSPASGRAAWSCTWTARSWRPTGTSRSRRPPAATGGSAATACPAGPTPRAPPSSAASTRSRSTAASSTRRTSSGTATLAPAARRRTSRPSRRSRSAGRRTPPSRCPVRARATRTGPQHIPVDFGDGGTATGVTASHQYLATGTYPITLTVTDNRGGVDTETVSVSVVAGPAPGGAGLRHVRADHPGRLGDRGHRRSVDDDGGHVGRWGSRLDDARCSGRRGHREPPGVSSTSTRQQLTVSLDKRPSGSGGWVLLRSRMLDGVGEYRAKLALTSGGGVSARLHRTDAAGAETAVSSLGDRRASPTTPARCWRSRSRWSARHPPPCASRSGTRPSRSPRRGWSRRPTQQVSCKVPAAPVWLPSCPRRRPTRRSWLGSTTTRSRRRRRDRGSSERRDGCTELSGDRRPTGGGAEGSRTRPPTRGGSTARSGGGSRPPAYLRGLTPDQVTGISACLTFVGHRVPGAAPPALWVGVVVSLALVLGYALDSADGQLARLRGGGSRGASGSTTSSTPSRTSSVHLAVAWSAGTGSRPSRSALGRRLAAADPAALTRSCGPPQFYVAMSLTDQLRLQHGGPAHPTTPEGDRRGGPVHRARCSPCPTTTGCCAWRSLPRRARGVHAALPPVPAWPARCS